MERASSVDEYFDKHPQWQAQLRRLREIILAAGLDETVKWGAPCYTRNKKNIIGLGAFKQHCAIWFFNGAVIDDVDGVLVNAQEGKTQHMRQWRFAADDSLDAEQIARYVQEAIDKFVDVKPAKASKQVKIPELLQSALDEDAELSAAFAALTPGKQREYTEHIDSAKRDATKQSRLEKISPMIKAGIGLNDKYKC